MALWGFEGKKGRSLKCRNGLFLEQSALEDHGALERTHPEARWLEPTFRFAQASLTVTRPLEQTLVHSSGPHPEASWLEPTVDSLELA